MSTDEETHYLYVLTNKSSKKQYVGVSKNPVSRFYEHMNLDTNPGIMKDRVNDEFTLDILNKGGKKYIYQLEELTINKLNTRVPFGYNISLGGCGGDSGNARKGSKCTNAKLNEDLVEEIRNKRARQGAHFKVLGAEYGVSATTIRNICLGKAWKHAGGPVEEPKTHKEAKERRETIRKLISGGFSCKQIAEKLDINETLVYYYKGSL